MQTANANINEREHEGKKLQVLNGKFGPYIKYDKKNFKITKDTDPKKLTLKACLDIIKKQEKK